MIVSIDGVSLETMQGDISLAPADAIVNAANNHFWMGSGVAGAIKRRGGPEIEREAVAKGPAGIGSAIVTGAGTLSAKYVIHAAVMGQDLITDQDRIRQATRSSLERTRELAVRSVAFPAFGTGVGGFSPQLAAEAMISECVDFVRGRSAPELRKILFVLFSEEILQLFNYRLEVYQEDR